VPGDDRVYFVLNLSKTDSWQAVSYEFARVLLNYNYPPVQRWFDEGFAEYFASLQIQNTQAQLGGDPEGILTSTSKSAPTSSPFIDLLTSTPWLTIPDLFNTRIDTAFPSSNSRHTIFFAQSWITMHYLITRGKLPDAGTYLGAVASGSSMDNAVQQAFGMSTSQFAQQIKEYLPPLNSALHSPAPTAGASFAPIQSLTTVTPENVTTTRHELLPFYAQALLAELELWLPEHHDQARQQLESLVGDSRTETAIARHALGWDDMVKGKIDKAREAMERALELDPKDGWAHYYQALMKYNEAQGGKEVKSLANMMEDLHIVLDWKSEFGRAYDMLAWAQREGGGVHAATDSIRAAMQLDPRNQENRLELARIYLAGKNWDAATALLNNLSSNSDPKIAAAAKSYLNDLPMLKKYGVAPQSSDKAEAAKPSSGTAAVPSTHTAPNTTASASTPENDSDDNADQPAEPKIDKRPIIYLKAKLVSVDCSIPPSAIVTVTSGAKTLKLRAADSKSLPLVGADQFSCEWKDRQVSVNYKASSAGGGDLVSLELR
jgi:tetratricopeptide (TPR) repeat protein